MDRNDSEIGIVWPGVVGEYSGTSSACKIIVDNKNKNLSDLEKKLFKKTIN